MAHYIQVGEQVMVSEQAAQYHNRLPVGTYAVKFSPTKSYYLEHIDPFSCATKLYGRTVERADRIMRAFADRPQGTGVMLSGAKGSGKTLLAKIISMRAAAASIPTLVVNSPFCGDEFNTFVQGLEQPAVLIFDEFEKVYDYTDQRRLLTLLDGTYPSKKLFVLTSNNSSDVDCHFKNRPGRIYYSMRFGGLSHEEIREFCSDHGVSDQMTESLCDYSVLFSCFSFDILQTCVEEHRRYPDLAFADLVEDLNASPANSDSKRYDVTLECDGKPTKLSKSDSSWSGNPFGSSPVLISYYDDDDEYCTASFGFCDVKSFSADGDRITFVNADGDRCVLQEKKLGEFSLASIL